MIKSFIKVLSLVALRLVSLSMLLVFIITFLNYERLYNEYFVMVPLIGFYVVELVVLFLRNEY
jgi:hypothetical protein